MFALTGGELAMKFNDGFVTGALRHAPHKHDALGLPHSMDAPAGLHFVRGQHARLEKVDAGGRLLLPFAAEPFQKLGKVMGNLGRPAERFTKLYGAKAGVV